MQTLYLLTLATAGEDFVRMTLLTLATAGEDFVRMTE